MTSVARCITVDIGWGSCFRMFLLADWFDQSQFSCSFYTEPTPMLWEICLKQWSIRNTESNHIYATIHDVFTITSQDELVSNICDNLLPSNISSSSIYAGITWDNNNRFYASSGFLIISIHWRDPTKVLSTNLDYVTCWNNVFEIIWLIVTFFVAGWRHMARKWG